MKISIENLGPISQAEYTLGDLTIICGGNNTGKTYATYALFGFLSFWNNGYSVKVKDEDVRITTHSDYIIKELNTLIMLNHDKPHLKRIADRAGYRDDELLSADKVRVYITEEDSRFSDKAEEWKIYYTLVPADIDPELGRVCLRTP